jgi:hypothetical protein
MVKIIKQILTMYVDASHSNWDDYLQSSISAYNTNKQASLQLTPNEALFARKPIKLADVMLDSPVNVTLHSQEDIVEYVEELKENSKRIHDKLNENLSKAHNVQKKNYDQAIRDTRKYQIGHLVSVVDERSIVGQSHAFVGPYKIIKKFNGDLNYQIVGLNNKKINSIHYNRVLPYRARND